MLCNMECLKKILAPLYILAIGLVSVILACVAVAEPVWTVMDPQAYNSTYIPGIAVNGTLPVLVHYGLWGACFIQQDRGFEDVRCGQFSTACHVRQVDYLC